MILICETFLSEHILSNNFSLEDLNSEIKNFYEEINSKIIPKR